MTQMISLVAQVPIEAAGKRLDVVAADLFPEYSRARLQSWIKAGDLLVNRQTAKTHAKVFGGEQLEVNAAEQDQGEWAAEPMDLQVVFEDESIMVLNKPAGLVVHPAAGNYEGTLLNGLLHYNPALRGLPRAGIVHRLDKDTSGLMVVAKTLSAQAHLVQQLQQRSVSRQYQALVIGHCLSRGEIEAPIGRDPKHRKKMAVISSGKEAKTLYKTALRLGPYSWVDVKLKTGRTHQIRVHFTHLGFPLVGDPTYGNKSVRHKQLTPAQLSGVQQFKRQALHARKLRLIHPATGVSMGWRAPVPDDLLTLLGLFDYEPS